MKPKYAFPVPRLIFVLAFYLGKLFTIPPAELKRIYKKMPDFVELSKRYDPHGKFRNEYLNKNIFST
jgi:hypothetical protein